MRNSVVVSQGLFAKMGLEVYAEKSLAIIIRKGKLVEEMFFAFLMARKLSAVKLMNETNILAVHLIQKIFSTTIVKMSQNVL